MDVVSVYRVGINEGDKMAGKPFTAGGLATTDGIGARKIVSDTVVSKPKTRKITPNGAGPRKQSAS